MLTSFRNYVSTLCNNEPSERPIDLIMINICNDFFLGITLD